MKDVRIWVTLSQETEKNSKDEPLSKSQVEEITKPIRIVVFV